jgi:hypothetical protein
MDIMKFTCVMSRHRITHSSLSTIGLVTWVGSSVLAPAGCMQPQQCTPLQRPLRQRLLRLHSDPYLRHARHLPALHCRPQEHQAAAWPGQDRHRG